MADFPCKYGVWHETWAGPPAVPFKTRTDAQEYADRLNERHPGHVVIEATIRASSPSETEDNHE